MISAHYSGMQEIILDPPLYVNPNGYKKPFVQTTSLGKGTVAIGEYGFKNIKY